MRYRFEPAIFASAPLDWRWHLASAFSQRLRKYTFTAAHTKTNRRRFQMYPLWRAFSNLCVYGERFYRLRVDGRPKRVKKFTSVCVYNRLRVDGALGQILIKRNIRYWLNTSLFNFDTHAKIKGSRLTCSIFSLVRPFGQNIDCPAISWLLKNITDDINVNIFSPIHFQHCKPLIISTEDIQRKFHTKKLHN